VATLEQSESIIKESLHTFDDPVLLNCKSGAEYLLFQLQPFNDSLTQLIFLYNNINENKDLNEKNFLKLIKYINTFTNLITDLVVSGKITSITAAALQQGQSKILFQFLFFKVSQLKFKFVFSSSRIGSFFWSNIAGNCKQNEKEGKLRE